MKGEERMIITIFYSKTNGEIYTSVFAENKYTHNRFGKFASDMEQVLDILYINGDEALFKSLTQYRVDLETKTLVLKANKINYL